VSLVVAGVFLGSLVVIAGLAAIGVLPAWLAILLAAPLALLFFWFVGKAAEGGPPAPF
jgi:hypothetical protein